MMKERILEIFALYKLAKK